MTTGTSNVSSDPSSGILLPKDKGPPYSSQLACHKAFWLVGGDPAKGLRWCFTNERSRALTIYRNIVDDERGLKLTPRGTILRLEGFGLLIGTDDHYWTKRPRERSICHTYQPYD